jgi:hypothetical protein
MRKILVPSEDGVEQGGQGFRADRIGPPQALNYNLYCEGAGGFRLTIGEQIK